MLVSYLLTLSPFNTYFGTCHRNYTFLLLNPIWHWQGRKKDGRKYKVPTAKSNFNILKKLFNCYKTL